MNAKINGVAIVIGLIVVVAVAGVAWRSYQMGIEEAKEAEKMATITRYDECIAAGYTMIRSFPRQCEMPNGTRLVDVAYPPLEPEEEGENTSDPSDPDTDTDPDEDSDESDETDPPSQGPTESDYEEYDSLQGEVLRLSTPMTDQTVSRPLVVRGEVPGYWSFEGDFPIVLTDWDGLIIGEGVAQIEGEWMTEEYVPFEATIEYERPTVYNWGYLILQRDNPSGLSENEDAVEFRVYFEDVATN